MLQSKTKSSTTVTVRVDTKLKQRLEQVATNQNRSNSFIIGEALAEYLHVREIQDAIVREAIASADRGEMVEHSLVKAWVESFGTDTVLPMPTPKVRI